MIHPDDIEHTVTMRGMSEQLAIAAMAHRRNLAIYYGAFGHCVGMGV